MDKEGWESMLTVVEFQLGLNPEDKGLKRMQTDIARLLEDCYAE